jgi:hypothetical protein
MFNGGGFALCGVVVVCLRRGGRPAGLEGARSIRNGCEMMDKAARNASKRARGFAFA